MTALSTPQVSALVPRFLLDSAKAGNSLASMLPTHTACWWPVVEDVFASAACKKLRHHLLDQAVAHEECSYLSIDGTFKVCLPLMGQGRFSDPRALRDQHPFPASDSYTRVLSVRGRSGAVLCLEPSCGEGADHIKACLQKSISAPGLLQVEHIASDNPSPKLFSELKSICANLKALSLDPTHTAMHYEQGLGGRKSAGSSLLRSFMVKFTNHDEAVTQNIWGPFFEGQACVALSREEQMLRQHILDSSLAVVRSKRILASCEELKVWPTRIQFVEALAALSCLHRTDMGRKIEGTKTTLAKLLHNVTSAEKLEWLFNNLRYRQFLPHRVRLLLPSGTTANEALHAEINSWYRQTQQMHRSTLVQKLQIQQLGKLLAHNIALHSPTAKQMPSSHVLSQRVGNPLWSAKTWQSDMAQQASTLPLKARRKTEKELVAEAAKKRPAAAPRPKARAKRTPFTLERKPGLLRSGVRKRNSM